MFKTSGVGGGAKRNATKHNNCRRGVSGVSHVDCMSTACRLHVGYMPTNCRLAPLGSETSASARPFAALGVGPDVLSNLRHPSGCCGAPQVTPGRSTGLCRPPNLWFATNLATALMPPPPVGHTQRRGSGQTPRHNPMGAFSFHSSAKAKLASHSRRCASALALRRAPPHGSGAGADTRRSTRLHTSTLAALQCCRDSRIIPKTTCS